MSRIHTTIAQDDAIRLLKTDLTRKNQQILALEERIESLVNQNLSQAKQIVALRRQQSSSATTALTKKTR